MSLIKGSIYKSKSLGKFKVLKQFDSIKFEELTNDDIRRLTMLKVLEEYKEYNKYLITVRYLDKLIGANIENLEVDEIETNSKLVYGTYNKMLGLPVTYPTTEVNPVGGENKNDITIIERQDPLEVKIELIDNVDKYRG